MATIVFFHGLNTYGDDDIHLGPLKFGSIHARLEKAFAGRGIEFISITGLGCDSPEVQANVAAEKLDAMSLPQHFHLLGQSTGGLIARCLGAHPKYAGRIANIMTVGCPNHGTNATDLGMNFAEKNRLMHHLFSMFGYDTKKKSQLYRFFTPEAVEKLNSKIGNFSQQNSKFDTPDGNNTAPRLVTLLCQLDFKDLSWPLVPLHKQIHPENEPSDGFIWSSTQMIGQVIGPFALDHFSQIGFFPHVSFTARKRAKKEFNKLVSAIEDIVSS